MPVLSAKHNAIKSYYERRQEIAAQGATTEMTVRDAFRSLLETTARANQWTLLSEHKLQGKRATPDATLRDEFKIPRGYWEAKDTKDDLEAEIVKKFDKGYPKNNIIFEDTRQAVLYQGGQREGQFDLAKPEDVADLLTRFLSYTAPNIEKFEQAVEHFKEITPDLAQGLLDRINDAHKNNKTFQTAFAAFMELCKSALNPNISQSAVDEMLIQHLLTERLMRTIFDNPEFAQRNAIANEIEKVISALTSKSLNRKEFLGKLDGFYNAIEAASHELRGFSEKQHFINTVYERFFQGYAVKVADTHGIVYTPQPIVDFMCAAVEEVLRDEFGYGLDHPDVCIIDPATGTGNFIINLLNRIHQRAPQALPDVYAKRLFANEVMLLPYYVSSLNIEHAYYELTGQYAPFEGLCFVDTLDLAEGAQMKFAFMTEKNSERVERQKQAKITVVIGNPPYNVGQLNENDNNKNRKYEVIDKRVRETYAKDSKATNRNAVSDAYVKFFRWATDRLQGHDGIVCFVSNNSFVDQIAFDGMRQNLLQDFTHVYHLDLHGNVRQNPKLSGTTHNAMGIQVGVGITVAIRSSKHTDRRLFYHRVPELWRKEEKLAYLAQMVDLEGKHNSLNTVQWVALVPDVHHTWRVAKYADEYASFVPIGSKETKSIKARETQALFKFYSIGITTSRDDVVYDFDGAQLKERIQTFVDDYNAEVDRYNRAGRPSDIDNFVRYEKLKWSRDLKRDLKHGNYAEYSDSKFRMSLYRPFCNQHFFFDRIVNQDIGSLHKILPTPPNENENRLICITNLGSEKPFMTLITNHLIDYHLVGAGSSTQCFPFYVYDTNGSNRRENITDWALAEFRRRYAADVSKWDIFYYVYALLHLPGYRARYADNLKRELPRIPFAGVSPSLLPNTSPLPNASEVERGLGGEVFRAFATAGKKLADLHLNYETIEPYPLEYLWKPDKPVSYRVEKMRLGSSGKGVEVRNADGSVSQMELGEIRIHDSLYLRGIPPAAQEYRLGNRSALDWVIDQYQVKTDKRSGITSDPNQYSDDEQYIVKLVGRVVQVSVETVKIVKGLPGLANSL